MTRRATLVLRPFAKINLSLHVGARRADGFHDVRTLMQAISLSDRLVMTRRSGPFALTCSDPALPADRTNLIYRAAARLWQAMGRDGEPRDLEIALTKKIPVAAGLGGGSADAAATLAGANRLWRARCTPPALADLAAGLGSDVPFFLCGGTALGLGRGEDLYPLEDARRLDVLVIKPAFGVTTADAYRWFDEEDGPEEATGHSPSQVDLGWSTGPVALSNSLYPPVARRHPQIEEMIEACLGAGAIGAAMTGSGSAVFGLFTTGTGSRAAKRLEGPGWSVFVTRTLTRREAGRLVGL